MLSNRLPEKIAKRLRLPLIAAPMLSVSGPELAIAACKAGVIGSFPLANARTVDGVDAWLTQIKSELASAADINPDRPPAPFCPNLIIKRTQMRDELQALVKHRVEMVITSVGSPADAIKPLHDVGCVVFADVASLHHAERAIAAGVDGLILLTQARADKPDGSIRLPSSAPCVRCSTDRSFSLAESRMDTRFGLPKCSVAISLTWEPSSSRRMRAWRHPRTRRCWSNPGWTT